MAISRLFPVVLGASAANLGRVLITKEFIEQDVGNTLLRTHVSENARYWVRLAERFAPTAQSTRILGFETKVLYGLSDPPLEDIFSEMQSQIELTGTVLWHENRPISRFAQHLISLDMAEWHQRKYKWENAIEWYWRLFALFPDSIPPQTRQDYYNTLGHLLFLKAENSHHIRLSIMASKAYWMAGDRNAAIDAVSAIVEREDLAVKDRAWVEFVLGMKMEYDGNLPEALRYYEESLKKVEAFPFAVFQQPKLLISSEILEQRKAEWAKVAFPAMNPESAQIRYILDQDILAMGLEVPIVLLWELPNRTAISSTDFGKGLAIGNGTWLTYGIAENHIRNGGFEWVISSEPRNLLGWSHGEATPPEPLRITDPETGMSIYVGRFPSKSNGAQTIYFADRAVRLDPNSYFLGGAQIRIVHSSPQQVASGWIGVRWPDSIGWLTAWDREEWHTGRLIVQSSDSSALAYIGLWVIPKTQGISEVLVDNAWLVRLPDVAAQ